MKKNILFTIFLFFSFAMSWAQIPTQPTDPKHPGSAIYEFDYQKLIVNFEGRELFVYLPTHKEKQQNQNFPLLVFGHGQAIGHEGYDLTFIHLARKGIAVLFPTYDKNFFDRNWIRMASDFNKQTQHIVKLYASLIDSRKVIYSGHSKGAYVSLVALGDPELKKMNFSVSSAVYFAPAGFDKNRIKNIDASIPVSIIWSEVDKIIKRSLVTEIYELLPNRNKQFILVKSYPNLAVDHFFPLSKSYIFGGENGVFPYHFYGSWKWLIGAAQDVESGGRLNNPYLYGEEADTTGDENLRHQILRSW